MNLDDLHRDLQEHIEIETRENMERGMTAEAARSAALRKFGNVARVTEQTYAVWHWMWLERLMQDLRYAWRGLRRNPGFAAVAILTLALGIGMNTAVFSVVNAVLLRPLPYPEARRLVWLSTFNERFKAEMVSGPDFFDWKAQAQSFDKMAAYVMGSFTLGVGSESDQAGVVSVTDDFFAITGARPAVGRLFTSGERNAVLITDRLFARRFGRDPKVVGKPITINGAPNVICGVLPASFRFVLPADFPGLENREIEAYVPIAMTPQDQVRGRQMMAVATIASLKPGVSVRQALSELQTIEAGIARQNPAGFYKFISARVLPLQEKLVGASRRALVVLLAAVGFVLLIACANIANLLLARATSRRREIAVRAAIGAGRARMIAQLLAEGVVLALVGGAAGLLLARVGLGAVVRFGSQAVPRLGETTMDLRVLGFTLFVSLATGILFGLGPALSLSRANLSHVLKEGGRLSSPGYTGISVRRVLMAAELAAALVLLTGAGLMIRSFWRMNAHPAGFRPESIVTMKLSLTGANYRGRSEQVAYLLRLLDRLAATPGVQAAGITNSTLRGFADAEGVHFAQDQAPQTSYHCVSAGYFQALGMRLAAGRWLSDDEPSPAVMINESFARRVFTGADPIGRRVRIPGSAPGQNPWATIVGVAGDLKYSKLDAEPAPELYLPFRQAPFIRMMNVVARAAGNGGDVALTLAKVAADIDRAQPVYDVETLEHALADSIAPRRFNLLLLAVFAAVALALAIVGIYGVMSYAVTQRSHEIGVRMALGAQRAEVVRMVVRQGMMVALLGIAVGVGAALGLTRVIATLLYDVRPTDPATFAAVSAMLAAAALLACCAPAFRASRVDPVVALRYE